MQEIIIIIIGILRKALSMFKIAIVLLDRTMKYSTDIILNNYNEVLCGICTYIFH